MVDFYYWMTVITDGAVYGSIYGLLGVCLVVIFRSNHLFNFCLTQLATFIILLVALVLEKNMPLLLTIVIAVFASFVVGGMLHVGVMRFITERKSSQRAHQSIITIGLLSIIDGLCNFFFTDQPSAFPYVFGEKNVSIFGLNVGYQSLGVIAVSWLSFGCVYAIFKFSKIGLKMEAVAENVVAARLRGIRASNVLAFAWALTTAMSVLAGIMIAPILFVFPQMFSLIFSYSLIAVVLGGIESPLGAVVSGMAIGIIENVGSQFSFIGSELKFIVVFVFLLLVLIFRPRGLWGRAEGRRG
jgi:branched-chain amino acid transport system permease protein